MTPVAAQPQDQLEWEARFSRPAAAAAAGSVLLQVASFLLQAPAIKDAPGSDDPDRHRASLINVQDHAGSILASSVAQAVAVALVAYALFYLFRATRRRRPELSAALRWLFLAAPVLMVVGTLTNFSNLKDVSDRFTESGAQTALAAPPTSADRSKATKECRDRRGSDSAPKREAFDKRFGSIAACASVETPRHKVSREDQLAEDLIEENRGVLGGTLLLAGGLAVALLLVVVSLNAMRAGLLSRFMGILGIIVGALQILPLLPLPIVQVFWLGALAALFLDRWPGGRGPAWETGEAVPWPSAAAIREQNVGDAVRKRFEPEEPAEPAEPNGPAEPSDHPVSKKRKRKRRR